MDTGLISPTLLSCTHSQDSLFLVPTLQGIHSQPQREADLSHLRLYQHLTLPTTMRSVHPGLRIHREVQDNPPLLIWASRCPRVLDKSAE